MVELAREKLTSFLSDTQGNNPSCMLFSRAQLPEGSPCVYLVPTPSIPVGACELALSTQLDVGLLTRAADSDKLYAEHVMNSVDGWISFSVRLHYPLFRNLTKCIMVHQRSIAFSLCSPKNLVNLFSEHNHLITNNNFLLCVKSQTLSNWLSYVPPMVHLLCYYRMCV